MILMSYESYNKARQKKRGVGYGIKPTRRVLFPLSPSSFGCSVRNLGFGLSGGVLFYERSFSSKICMLFCRVLCRIDFFLIINLHINHIPNTRSHLWPTRPEQGKEDVVRSTSALASETLKRVLKKTGKHRLRGVSVAFTAMGEHELGDFHMHELFGNPQKFRRAHFEGTIDAVG